MKKRKADARKPRASKSSPLFSITLAVGAVLFIGFFAVLSKRPAATVTRDGSPDPAEQRKAVMAALVAQTRHFEGQPDAPVTIFEFSDFQ